MRISSKGRLAVGIVGILAVAGLVIWWALQQGQLPQQAKVLADIKKDETQRKEFAKVEAKKAAEKVAVEKKKAEERGDVADDAPQEPEPPKTWEDHLDEILLADDNENSKTDRILSLMQTAPPEAQEELSQHLVNMAQDDHYDGVSNLLMNISTSTNVDDVLMNDLLNRNNTLKLNTLLSILEMPSHPMHDNAKEMLELFVQDDHGEDLKAWEKAVADWLKENEPPPQAQVQGEQPAGGDPQPQVQAAAPPEATPQ
jgi:hypothetical protein